jgi:hypothetical protein
VVSAEWNCEGRVALDPHHRSPSWPPGKAHPAAATRAGGAAPQAAGGAAAEDGPTSMELRATKGDVDDGMLEICLESTRASFVSTGLDSNRN